MKNGWLKIPARDPSATAMQMASTLSCAPHSTCPTCVTGVCRRQQAFLETLPPDSTLPLLRSKTAAFFSPHHAPPSTLNAIRTVRTNTKLQ